MSNTMIRYRRLGYVNLNVTNLERSRRFYEELTGLEFVGETPDGDVSLRCSNFHHDIILSQADSPGVRRIAWQMENEAALAALADLLARTNVEMTSVPDAEADILGTDGGFRVIDPTTGAQHEFFISMQMPERLLARSHTQIDGLGHVVLASTNMAASEAFYKDVLNFRESDRITDIVVHLRCFPNPLHHSFGLGAGKAPGLHHLTFMVRHMDDIGRAKTRMEAAGVPIVYGPGRHPQSGPLFLYFLDPDGLTLEYSQGMEEFSERDPRPPRRFDLHVDSMDFWGNLPKPGFAAVGAIG